LIDFNEDGGGQCYQLILNDFEWVFNSVENHDGKKFARLVMYIKPLCFNKRSIT
jgi:hypothetical protein